MANSGMSARAWTLFAAVSVLWGIPYLFIKLAVEDLSPVMVAWGRIAVAFAVLLPYAIHKGALRGLGRHWKPLLIYSIVEIVLSPSRYLNAPPGALKNDTTILIRP